MDTIEGKLLATLSQIDPKKLKSIGHDEYVSSLANTLISSLEQDYSHLLLFIQAIKDCEKPCYKRDVLVETLDRIFIVQRDKVLLKLLCDIAQDNRDFVPWKEMANVLVTLPDLVANCGLLKKFPGASQINFYKMLLETIYLSLLATKEQHQESLNPRKEMTFFYAHLIGRIAISGFGTLVWNKFTSPLCVEEDSVMRSLGSTILCVPIGVAEFEIFIEPLYGPIFYHMRPSPTNGEIIESIIGASLLSSEILEHIVCKKHLLQTNFNQDRHRQNLILYNIFSYLSRLVNNNKPTMAAATPSANTSIGAVDSGLDMGELKESDILINTVLEVAKSWSDSTKILLRSYEHNRYVGCALVMALRFALEREHKQWLLLKADEIQTEVIRGLQVYLNRSSKELRNIAMCVGEILLTRLHDLMDAELAKENKKRVPLELNIDWDESCLAIKRMSQLDIDTFCGELDSHIGSHADTTAGGDSNHDLTNDGPKNELRNEASACDDDNDVEDDDITTDVPIYLNDCINGMIDNNNPRYVRICLLKVNDLIRQLSKENNESKVDIAKRSVLKKSTTNDAIRDVAIELAQVLLYLEDQYSLDNFDALQRSALVSLTVSTPDLVAKYLLDELNNQSRNIRLQTIILQTLIESAQQLGNGFTKYGALYFYGMVHQLKISTFAPSPSALSIVSAVKSMKADQLLASDDSYLLSRVLLSVSLIIKCLDQQLITCKLSNDLLDILASYRHHPDSGVRKAIVSCLTVIRDCTPVVYFREHLNDKTAHLFGAWLAIESEFIREDK